MDDLLAETSRFKTPSRRGKLALQKNMKKKPSKSSKPSKLLKPIKSRKPGKPPCRSCKRCKPCRPCPPLLGTTMGINVLNQTKSISFTLTSVDGPAGNPPIGSILAPGGLFNFEVRSTAFKTNRVLVVYTGVVNGNAFPLSFELVNIGGITLNVESIKTTGPVTIDFNTTVEELFITDK
ncbi:hypothetical protein CGZ75_14835 [Paenibacillus herberti]|uniref:Uncharacterized protein n=1 Tax=Paenibacillus herberti TaxID=1619309 RepID=A0A229NWC3_9BACL|nr:hypothetical protein CGZ75_14835 [Paenibacillus herberti]